MQRPGVRRLFSISLRRDRWERDVEDEILTHLANRAERLMEQGMSAAEAKNEAMRRFGSLEEGRTRLLEAASHREDYMRRKEAFAELRQDLSFATRALSHNKGWAAVAITTLALGIGATTAVWSAATTLLLHPLPYPGADRIVNVNLQPTTGNSTGIDITITPDAKQVIAWREQSRSFEAIEPYSTSSKAVGAPGHAEDAIVASVSATFVSFAGEHPIQGRNFTEAELRSREPVGLLGESLWRTRFGAGAVVGQSLLVDGKPVRIVGVLPSTLQTPRIGGKPAGVWVPLDLTAETGSSRVIGRLRKGVTAESARRELDSISARSQLYPAGALPFKAALTSPGQTVSFRDSLIMLTGAVLFVLLVAAANVAHLLLARAVNRQREVAIRAALGASRGRLVRQMMTETFFLCGIGVGFGIMLGTMLLDVMIRFRPATLPELDAAHVDRTALLAIIGITLLCAIAFGAIAAVAASSRRGGASLRSGVVASFSRSGERFRSSLVVTEMALSAMLLVGAALLVRSVIDLQRSDLGFDPVNLHGITGDFPRGGSTTPASRAAGMRQLAQAIATVPGVVAVTVTDAIPSYRNFSIGALEIEGKPQPDLKKTSFIDVGGITPSYLRTIGGRLVEGRLPEDSSANAGEILVNEGFARKQWKPGDAVGKRLRVVYQGRNNDWLTVVGVVHDIQMTGPVGDKAAPFLYTALKESSTPGVVYRTDGSPATIAQVLTLARRQFPNVRMSQPAAEDAIASAVAPSRFVTLLMTSFTLLAVLLAAIGLYGMMAYAVAQRTREIGIRMALGATREQIARGVVGRGALLGVVGAGIGLALAMWGTRIIESSLYGVSRLAAASFVIGGVSLVSIAILASLLPMRRAVAVDPVTAIRAD